MTITLPLPLRQYAESQIKAGKYSDFSDYISHLIHVDQSNQLRHKLEELLLEGLNSGPSLEVTEDYWKNKQKILTTSIKQKRRIKKKA